jgi:hypothetical protein
MSARVARTFYLVVNIVKSALLLLAPAAKKVVGERCRVAVLRGVGGLGGSDDGLGTAVGKGLEGCACKSREMDCGLHVHHLGDGRDPSFGRVELEMNC